MVVDTRWGNFYVYLCKLNTIQLIYTVPPVVVEKVTHKSPNNNLRIWRPKKSRKLSFYILMKRRTSHKTKRRNKRIMPRFSSYTYRNNMTYVHPEQFLLNFHSISTLRRTASSRLGPFHRHVIDWHQLLLFTSSSSSESSPRALRHPFRCFSCRCCCCCFHFTREWKAY